MTNQEKAHTVALAELEKIQVLSSGSYNAAVSIKDALAAELSAEVYERIKPQLQALVTNTSEIAERMPRIEELLRQSADENAEAVAKSRRISWIEIGIGILEIVVAITIALKLIG